MHKVLITLSGGLIDEVVFFNDTESAILALSDYVKAMDPERNDAAVYDTGGLIANAKDFLDEKDGYVDCIQAVIQKARKDEKSKYIIGNPRHPMGFIVASTDDPIGITNSAEAVSELGQMRKTFGMHLNLYTVHLCQGRIVTKSDLVKFNADCVIEDFNYSLVEAFIK